MPLPQMPETQAPQARSLLGLRLPKWLQQQLLEANLTTVEAVQTVGVDCLAGYLHLPESKTQQKTWTDFVTRLQHTADAKPRCFGNNIGELDYAEYHDFEWGIPVFDDSALFEMLMLEGTQAGLSWLTVLRKRNTYRFVFHQFDIDRVADMKEAELNEALHNPGLIRHSGKLHAIRHNARIAQELRKHWRSLNDYCWSWVDGQPLVNTPQQYSDVPAQTQLSVEISKDLQQRGMRFVGPTVIYAFLQACGLVNDHLVGCWRK